jgi:hypothetical protein
MNSEIEKARREFLDECDFVLRIPACLYLDDDYGRLISKVIALPLYTYYGVKEKGGDVEVENRYLNYDSHIGLGEISLTDVASLEEGETIEATKEITKHMEKQPFAKFLNFQDRAYKRLAKCKLKIWSETPRIKSGSNAMFTTGIHSPSFIEYAIILFCFENNLSFEEFNLFKEKYKELLRKNKIKNDILNLPEKLTEEEKKASKFIKEICRTFMLMNPFDWGAAELCSFFGAIHAERHHLREDKAEELEMLLVQFPVPKNLPKNTPEYVLEEFKKGKICGLFSPDLQTEIYMKFYSDYIEEIFNKKQLRIDFKTDMLREPELALVYWEGHEKGLFGPVLSSFFPHYLKDFELKLKEEEKLSFPIGKKASIKIQYTSFSNTLRLLGPSEMVWKAIREIKDSGKGWVHYYSGRMGWEADGARFLRSEEYKLPKPPKGKVAVIGEKPEEMLEINFEKGKIEIGSTVKSKYKQIFELLEYFINKGEDVHWIEGIRIFDDWKKIRNDIYNLKAIFEVIISRLRGPKGFFKKNNLNLDITNLDKGFYRLESSHSSNIIKARELTREAELLIDAGEFNMEEVKQKIKGAIEIYESCSEAHILMIKLLKDIESREKDMIPTRRFFTKQVQFLEEVKSTVEYYKNNLQKIEWEKTEKREEVQQEFKNEIGFFLIAVQQDLDEMKTWFDILTKWPETESLSLPAKRGFEEFKKLLEQDKIQELLEIDIIKQLRGITKGIVIGRIPHIRKWEDKKIDNYVSEILSDAIDNAKENIDFSKVSSVRSLKKYLLKLIKDAIYQDFFERIGLTKAEWKDYKEVERIKEELRQRFGREPEEEEWQELLLEKKKRGGEYREYIKEICNKAKAIVSLRWDIASKEDEDSSENDIEKSDYAEEESEE